MVCVYERAEMLIELWCRNYGVNLIWKWIKAAFPSMTFCTINSARLSLWISPGLWWQLYFKHRTSWKIWLHKFVSQCIFGLPLNVQPLLLLAPLCSKGAQRHSQSGRTLSIKKHSLVFNKQRGCCVSLPCANHQSQQEATTERCFWRLLNICLSGVFLSIFTCTNKDLKKASSELEKITSVVWELWRELSYVTLSEEPDAFASRQVF